MILWLFVRIMQPRLRGCRFPKQIFVCPLQVHTEHPAVDQFIRSTPHVHTNTHLQARDAFSKPLTEKALDSVLLCGECAALGQSSRPVRLNSCQIFVCFAFHRVRALYLMASIAWN